MNKKTQYGVNNEILVWCPLCKSWLNPNLINVTGYTDAICPLCDYTIIEDYYGFKKIEDNQQLEDINL